MRYASIRDMDIINGTGIGVSIFTQGCSHHCKGCFNQSTWDFSGGKEFTIDDLESFVKICNRDYIDHISILGGEPLDQIGKDEEVDVTFTEFLAVLKNVVKKPIWVWTGYTMEQIQESNKKNVLEYIDYIVDGKFHEDKKDLNLMLRGSSNQRIWSKKENNSWEDITENFDK